MPRSRRNLYRILHVQPEAPGAVIRAAYRALMITLRSHPDLGGGHEQAALINAAYAILKDPQRRAAYDRGLLPIIRRARGSGGLDTGAPLFRPDATRDAAPPAPPPANSCPFCCAELPTHVDQDTRCRRCKSPLAHPPDLARSRERADRRASARATKTNPVDVQPMWRGALCRAQLRDLSLSGMSLRLPVRVAPQQVIRVFDPDFEALALVVRVRPDQKQFVIHTRLLTMLVKRTAGVFIRTAA